MVKSLESRAKLLVSPTGFKSMRKELDLSLTTFPHFQNENHNKTLLVSFVRI